MIINLFVLANNSFNYNRLWLFPITILQYVCQIKFTERHEVLDYKCKYEIVNKKLQK